MISAFSCVGHTQEEAALPPYDTTRTTSTTHLHPDTQHNYPQQPAKNRQHAGSSSDPPRPPPITAATQTTPPATPRQDHPTTTLQPAQTHPAPTTQPTTSPQPTTTQPAHATHEQPPTKRPLPYKDLPYKQPPTKRPPPHYKQHGPTAITTNYEAPPRLHEVLPDTLTRPLPRNAHRDGVPQPTRPALPKAPPPDLPASSSQDWGPWAAQAARLSHAADQQHPPPQRAKSPQRPRQQSRHTTTHRRSSKPPPQGSPTIQDYPHLRAPPAVRVRARSRAPNDFGRTWPAGASEHQPPPDDPHDDPAHS